MRFFGSTLAHSWAHSCLPQNARIPFMLVDGLLIYGLHVWESSLKKEKDMLAGKEALHHEEEKKAARALKAATRQERKAQEKKIHIINKSSGQQKPFIHQPDKSK